jgi:hypothetical protein
VIETQHISLGLTGTGLASRTKAKAQFFDLTLHSLFEFTDEIYNFGRYSIQFNLIQFNLLFILHLQQLVAFLIHPFCPTGFWDGNVLYAHYSITILLRL